MAKLCQSTAVSPPPQMVQQYLRIHPQGFTALLYGGLSQRKEHVVQIWEQHPPRALMAWYNEMSPPPVKDKTTGHALFYDRTQATS